MNRAAASLTLDCNHDSDQPFLLTGIGCQLLICNLSDVLMVSYPKVHSYALVNLGKYLHASICTYPHALTIAWVQGYILIRHV